MANRGPWLMHKRTRSPEKHYSAPSMWRIGRDYSRRLRSEYAHVVLMRSTLDRFPPEMSKTACCDRWLPRGYCVIPAWLLRGYCAAARGALAEPHIRRNQKKMASPADRPGLVCRSGSRPTRGTAPWSASRPATFHHRYHGCMVAAQEAQTAAKMTMRIGRSMEGININGLL